MEVQRSLRESALRIEDLPADPSSQSVSPPPQFSQDLHFQLLSSEMAIGGPAGLWHFIYKSIYLDQYVSSEFPLIISNPKQQKRYCILIYLLNTIHCLFFIRMIFSIKLIFN